MQKTIKIKFYGDYKDKEMALKTLKAVGFKCKDPGNLSPYLIIKYFEMKNYKAIRQDLYHTDQYSYYSGFYRGIREVGFNQLLKMLGNFSIKK